MPLSPSDAREIVARYLPAWRSNFTDIDRIDRWSRGRNQPPNLPRGATMEYRELQDRSPTPWLGLVVTAVAQSLYVDGYHRKDNPEDSDGWDVWQANALDARQVAVHRAALAHGLSYMTVMPGSLQGRVMPVLRGVSARKMIALYADPAEDEWPMYALRGEHTKLAGVKGLRLRLYDNEAVYTFDAIDGSDSPTFITFDEHPAQVCPVVRFANMLDLEGRTPGEVEPFIPLAARIDQDTFDRLIVQRFGSWKVRYIAGMAKPETDSEKRAAELKLRVTDLLVSEDKDTKFGTLDATPLDGYIAARDSDIRDLAAVTQTPPHHLLGQMANLSAEALAAAEASLTRKVEERKHVFGESHEQALRLAQYLRGDVDGAADFASQVRWRDMESRSLAQAADALGKLAQMLNVPVQMLWEKIPGFTKTDVERAKQMFAEGDALDALIRSLAEAGEPGPGEPG
ncbi:MAG TPA: phage portal protein [Nitriliruptorales bacterium]